MRKLDALKLVQSRQEELQQLGVKSLNFLAPLLAIRPILRVILIS